MRLFGHSSSFAAIFWAAVPFLVIVVLILLTLIPAQLPLNATNLPFPLLAIFYWAVFRPESVSVGVIFVAGLLVDFLSGSSIGMHTFLYVLIFSISKGQRRFLIGQGFLTLWVSFFLVCVLHQAVLWGVYHLLQKGVAVAFFPLLFSGAIVAALLPVSFPVLATLNKRLDDAEDEAL